MPREISRVTGKPIDTPEAREFERKVSEARFNASVESLKSLGMQASAKVLEDNRKWLLP